MTRRITWIWIVVFFAVQYKLCAQNTSIVNHISGDTTGVGLNPVPSSTKEHRIIINYYEPANKNQLDQFEEIIRAYLNLYLDNSAKVENDKVVLKKNKKETTKDLDNIVKGALKFYDYKELKDFKGFSKSIEKEIENIGKINFEASGFNQSYTDEATRKLMQKHFLEKEIADLKVMVSKEVGLYGKENLLVYSSSEETVIDDKTKEALLSDQGNYDPDKPLEPFEIKLSDTSIATINFKDNSTLFPNNSSNNSNPDDNEFAARVLKLLEQNNTKLDGMQKQIDELRSEQVRLWQQKQDDTNLALQQQIDELRKMVVELVKYSTGEATASTSGGGVRPASSSTVSNVPQKISVYFAKGSINLNANSQLSLNEIIDILARNPGYQLVITGYADHVGDPSKNLMLSQQRAKVVKSFLQASGLGADRFVTRYLGDKDSSFENAQDRKVVLEFVAN
jgi:outer membrane protein OmpA-like peptidoglycan-associated protein